MVFKGPDYECTPAGDMNMPEGKDSAGKPYNETCPLSAICEQGVQDTDWDTRLGKAPVKYRHINRGEYLFAAGDSFHGLYVLRSGAFKNLAMLDESESQVVDFRLPGDVLGMAALNSGRYPFSALALEPSEVCELSIDSSNHLCLHPDLLATMSRQLQRIQWASVLLRTQSAEQRVIHFLLQVSTHWRPHTDDAVDMKLPMSRKDIANYLGIAVETVSRTLHGLQSDGLLSTSGRNVQLLNCDAMAQRLRGTEPVHYA